MTEDLTGRRRILKNTLVSWGSMFIIMAVGFILPRVIDEQMGQETLGIWDFCWSIVNYLSFANLGASSAVSRYVATFRAQHDDVGISQVVTTNYLIQALTVIVVGGLLAVFLHYLPSLVHRDLGDELGDIDTIVMILGSSVIVQLLFAPSRGVINGCHRWDITNLVNVSIRLVASFIMIVLAIVTRDLADMALAYLLTNACGEMVRCYLSFRICPGINLSRKSISLPMAKGMLKFGFHQTLIETTPLILLQGINIAVMRTLGAEPLAILARSTNLIKYIEIFVSRFTKILSPSTAALCALDKEDELSNFYIKGTRYAAAITFPMLMTFAVFGDAVIALWMGEDYVRHDVIMALSMGYLLPVTMGPSLSVLIGMNAHARIALIGFLFILIGAIVGLAGIGMFGWSLLGFSVLEGTLLTLAFGILAPYYCCQKVGLGFFSFLKASLTRPLACITPYVIGLIASKFLLSQYGGAWVLVGVFTSMVLYLYLLWIGVLPDDVRLRVVGRIGQWRQKRAPGS